MRLYRNIRLITCLSVMIFAPFSYASHQTATHIYILSEKEHSLLVIDRKTGEENVIPVGQYPKQFAVWKDRGYVVNFGSDSLSVISLTSNVLIDTIELEMKSGPDSIAFYNDTAYVGCSFGEKLLAVDLKTKKTFTIKSYTEKIAPITQLDHLLIVPCKSRNVIELRNIVSFINHNINLRHSPDLVVTSGTTIYVLHSWSRRLSVVKYNEGLRCWWDSGSIDLGNGPRALIIHLGMGYILNFHDQSISIIDLKTYCITGVIPLTERPVSMVCHDDRGYVRAGDRIFVIDLLARLVLQSLPNPLKLNPDVSDTHLYVGLKRTMPLKLILFDTPFLDIYGGESGDEAFKEYETALKDNTEQAYSHFNVALAAGHPKAHAVAAYAYLHGLWGATDNLQLHYEYSLLMDKAYYASLVNRYAQNK